MYKEGLNMAVSKKYLRGTISHVAEQLGLTYAGARLQLINDVTKAKLIALEYEESLLLQQAKQLEEMKEKEERISQMKSNLGLRAN